MELSSLPKFVTKEYLLYLPANDLKNMYNMNKKIRNICIETKIWKDKLIIDFKQYYDNLPIYLNEPDWMKVYYWIEKRNKLYKKFLFMYEEHVIVNFQYSDILFNQENDTSEINIERIMGSILNLNKIYVGVNDVKILCGLYIDKYYFTIGVEYPDDENRSSSFIIYINHNIKQSNRLHSVFINDIKKLLLISDVSFYDLNLSENNIYWNKTRELFMLPFIPNENIFNPYEYYNVEKLLVNNTENTKLTDYITSKLLILKPHILKSKDIKDILSKNSHNSSLVYNFINSLTDNVYDSNFVSVKEDRATNADSIRTQNKYNNLIENSEFEIYSTFNGTPFFICSIKNDKHNLFIYCDSESTPTPLIDKISECINEYINTYHT